MKKMPDYIFPELNFIPDSFQQIPDDVIQEINVISEALEQLLVQFFLFLPGLIAALVLFFLALYLAGVVSRTARRALERREVSRQINQLLTKIVHWSVVIMGIIVALQQVGFNVTAFIAGLGIVGFAIGFALQDVSKNFVSGVLLLIQQPFRLGDAIDVSGFAGTVVAIDLRATELHTFDGQVVLIPNADVFTKPITNYTRAASRRVELDVSVALDSDLELIRRAALGAIATVPGLLDAPPPRVLFRNFGPAKIVLSVYYWIDTELTDEVGAKDVGLRAVKAAFDQAGIKLS
jgi:small conductance mechanosensitive channel